MSLQERVLWGCKGGVTGQVVMIAMVDVKGNVRVIVQVIVIRHAENVRGIQKLWGNNQLQGM